MTQRDPLVDGWRVGKTEGCVDGWRVGETVEEQLNTAQIVTEVFAKSFEIDEASVPSLVYEGIDEWDSIGHMMMIAEMEDRLGCQIELDDIISISDFDSACSVAEKYLDK